MAQDTELEISHRYPQSYLPGLPLYVWFPGHDVENFSTLKPPCPRIDNDPILLCHNDNKLPHDSSKILLLSSAWLRQEKLP